MLLMLLLLLLLMLLFFGGLFRVIEPLLEPELEARDRLQGRVHVHLVGLGLHVLGGLEEGAADGVALGEEPLDPVGVGQRLLPLFVLLGQRVTSADGAAQQQVADLEDASHDRRNQRADLPMGRDRVVGIGLH